MLIIEIIKNDILLKYKNQIWKSKDILIWKDLVLYTLFYLNKMKWKTLLFFNQQPYKLMV